MGGAVGQVDLDGLDPIHHKLRYYDVRRAHEKGISQYSANMVATILMTISLLKISSFSQGNRFRADNLVLSVAVVSTKMFFVFPATILESIPGSAERAYMSNSLTLRVNDGWH
jgi:ABC-type transport system involved in cytochrome c biogenesis permease subunit